MIGKPVNYDKRYKDEFPIFEAKLDCEFKKCLDICRNNCGKLNLV